MSRTLRTSLDLRVLLSKPFGPFPSGPVVLFAVGEVLIGDGAHERIAWIAVGKQRAYAEQHLADVRSDKGNLCMHIFAR